MKITAKDKNTGTEDIVQLLTLRVRGSTLDVRNCRRLWTILTSKVGPRTEGVKIFIMAVEP